MFLHHVIQNVVDPVEMLNDIRGLLSDGGLLYVEAGDVFRVPETYGPDFLIHLQNEHCWYFTKDTLAALLSRSGFEVVRADGVVRA